MIPRRAQRRDANEADLVDALRKAGMLWVPGHSIPVDGFVGWRGRWQPVEVKDPRQPLSKRALTEREAHFLRDCQAYQLPFILAHTAEDVLRAFGP